jgi:hypothetical protein
VYNHHTIVKLYYELHTNRYDVSCIISSLFSSGTLRIMFDTILLFHFVIKYVAFIYLLM